MFKKGNKLDGLSSFLLVDSIKKTFMEKKPSLERKIRTETRRRGGSKWKTVTLWCCYKYHWKLCTKHEISNFPCNRTISMRKAFSPDDTPLPLQTSPRYW